MDRSPTAATATSPLVRDWLRAMGYWLGGRRGLIGLAVVLGLAAVTLNWGWLVAAGIAPVLMAVAPCALMCALGLCMNKMIGGSCSSTETAAGDGASQVAQPTLPPAAAPDPNQLALSLDDSGTAARPKLVARAASADATETEAPKEEKSHA